MTEVVRIPHAENPTEVRQAFQRFKRKSENIDISDDTNLAVTSPIVLTGDTLSLNLAATDHDSLLNFVANKHIDHTGVTLTAGSGLAGGGTIADNRTFDLDINSLGAAAIAAGDFVPFWDITATATNKKITFANFEGTLSHDSLSGVTANEHIDWTNASDALVTSSTGRFAYMSVGTAPVAGLGIYVNWATTDFANARAIYVYYISTVTSTAAKNNYGLDFTIKPDVSTGVENTGNLLAIQGNIVASSIHQGTQRRMKAMQFAYGSGTGATGTITHCMGLELSPYIVAGTITNLYDLLINVPLTGGAITNHWSLYNASTADSYFASQVGLGITTPDARLEIETGATEGKQAVTIDQNDDDQPFIDFQGTAAASAATSISTWTAGNSIQGFVWIEVNGVKKRMPYYDEPTS